MVFSFWEVEITLNSIRLSKRLLAVASFVLQDAVVADIGSDHAYLPSFLIEKEIIKKAIAGEVAQGPFDSAMKNVSRNGFSEYITVRLANGLAAIEENDGIDTVTIAGMGGSLIASILNTGVENLQGVERIIVQPNIHAKAIREWAIVNGWKIVDEKILKEDEKIYEILVLERGNVNYDDLELLVGPILKVEKNEVFIEKWQGELLQWHQVLKAIEQASETTETVKKIEEMQANITMVGKELEQ